MTVPDPQIGQMPHASTCRPTPRRWPQIAEPTGGRFFEAPTARTSTQIYESLGSRVGYTHEEREVTQWFAAAGLLFVVAGAGLAAQWFNRFP